ncbi:MAG: ATP-binding cassette domain-containing protein [bacterium]
MKTILEMRNIIKDFPGVRALKGVSFKVEHGEIHALCGENGAGKSTLMKILAGVYGSGTFQGEILLGEKQANFRNITDSERNGIAIISQELALVPGMTVAENIFLGREIRKFGMIDWRVTREKAGELLERLGLGHLDPGIVLGKLGVGQQQMVEIAKAISKNASILILDEPTSALTEKETQCLLDLLIELKGRGISSILISHKLKELIRVSDKITVLRDGASVGSAKTKEANEAELVKMMVGRTLNSLFNKQTVQIKGEALRIEQLTLLEPHNGREKTRVEKASLNIKEGEIAGLAGLMGAGRSELVSAVFGTYPGKVKGDIYLYGEKKIISNPGQAINAGIALVTEDRKRYGLVLEESITFNTTLACVSKWARYFVLRKSLEKEHTANYSKHLGIKAPSIEEAVKNLSGGNQQKVVLAKWLITKPKILILDEPTRGIDVGAKEEIYSIVQKLAQDGTAILVVSSELPELLGICDKIYVMHEGAVTGCLHRNDATQEKIMSLAAGLKREVA